MYLYLLFIKFNFVKCDFVVSFGLFLVLFKLSFGFLIWIIVVLCIFFFNMFIWFSKVILLNLILENLKYCLISCIIINYVMMYKSINIMIKFIDKI